MQQKFDAIIIRVRPYSDSSLIVKCFSRESGLQSFIARGVKKKKKNSNIGLYQVLSHVEIESYSKSENTELKSVKQIRANYQYKSLYYDVYKAGIVQFLAEILDMAIVEEEQNTLLYDFIINSVHYLDELEEYANFHIVFLLELSKYLGFYPHDEGGEVKSFDLEKGVFYSFDDKSVYSINGEIVLLLREFLGTKFVHSKDVKINRKHRVALLRIIIQYYELHVSNFRKPKSLEILESLYN